MLGKHSEEEKKGASSDLVESGDSLARSHGRSLQKDWENLRKDAILQAKEKIEKNQLHTLHDIYDFLREQRSEIGKKLDLKKYSIKTVKIFPEEQNLEKRKFYLCTQENNTIAYKFLNDNNEVISDKFTPSEIILIEKYFIQKYKVPNFKFYKDVKEDWAGIQSGGLEDIFNSIFLEKIHGHFISFGVGGTCYGKWRDVDEEKGNEFRLQVLETAIAMTGPYSSMYQKFKQSIESVFEKKLEKDTALSADGAYSCILYQELPDRLYPGSTMLIYHGDVELYQNRLPTLESIYSVLKDSQTDNVMKIGLLAALAWELFQIVPVKRGNASIVEMLIDVVSQTQKLNIELKSRKDMGTSVDLEAIIRSKKRFVTDFLSFLNCHDSSLSMKYNNQLDSIGEKIAELEKNINEINESKNKVSKGKP